MFKIPFLIHFLLFLIAFSYPHFLIAEEATNETTKKTNNIAEATTNETTKETNNTVETTTKEPTKEMDKITKTDKLTPMVESFLGITSVPKASWSFPGLFNKTNDELSYTMKDTTITTYDANVRINKLETSLGVNVIMAENSFIRKVHRFSGYIGLRNMSFRVMKGNIEGTAQWSGQLATGMPGEIDFKNKFTSYDLLYNFLDEEKSKNIDFYPGWYIGFGYTDFSSPAYVSTLITEGGKENQKYGKPVYEANYRTTAFSFIFGFDTMKADILLHNARPGDIKAFAHAYDRVGIGKGKINDATVSYAEELNPGRTFVDAETIIVFIENDSSIGISWAPSLLKGHILVALAYNMAFQMISNFGGFAEKSTDLGHDINYGMLRHGPLLRIFGTW